MARLKKPKKGEKEMDKSSYDQIVDLLVSFSKEKGVHRDHITKLLKKIGEVPGDSSFQEQINSIRKGFNGKIF